MFLALLPYILSGGILGYIGYKGLREYNRASDSILLIVGLTLMAYGLYRFKK